MFRRVFFILAECVRSRLFGRIGKFVLLGTENFVFFVDFPNEVFKLITTGGNLQNVLPDWAKG